MLKLEERGHRFVRYADDFVVICRTKWQCEQAEARIRVILERLGLELHPEKTRRVELFDGREGFDFLGCHLRKRGERIGLLELQTLWPFPRAALERFLDRVQVILVPEMNRGQIYREVLRVVRGRCEVHKYSRVSGDLVTPTEIVKSMRKAI